MTATAVTRTTATPVIAFTGAMTLRIGPGWTTSRTASRARLKELLPKTLPMARSYAPSLRAAIEATSSGREVLSATRVVPTNVLPSPLRSASSSAACARKGPARRMTRPATAKPAIALRRLIAGGAGISTA